jgi:uncharacterized MAPEG superfamily protein
VAGNLQLGTATALSPRDDAPPLKGTAGRLQRAMNNHFEALILFAIAVLVVTLSGKSSPVTELAAHTYLIARILYVPAYASGAVPWRSLIWSVGFVATLVMLLAALF